MSGLCRFGAVQHDWSKDIKILECGVAEHAKGVLAGKDGRAAFVNYAISITKDCDCMGHTDHNIVRDIGILGSTDPVAVDAAAIDLMEKTAGKPLNEISEYPNLNGKWQIEHAEKNRLSKQKIPCNFRINCDTGCTPLSYSIASSIKSLFLNQKSRGGVSRISACIGVATTPGATHRIRRRRAAARLLGTHRARPLIDGGLAGGCIPTSPRRPTRAPDR